MIDVIIIVGLICFLLGVFITYHIFNKEISKLQNENNNIRLLSADKLKEAYEQIEKLKEDNIKLIKQIKLNNYDTKH